MLIRTSRTQPGERERKRKNLFVSIGVIQFGLQFKHYHNLAAALNNIMITQQTAFYASFSVSRGNRIVI